MNGQIFGLSVRIEIYPCEIAPNNIPYRSSASGPAGLEVREEAVLGAMDFKQIAEVLGRFHDLAQAVQATRQDPPW